MLNKIKHFVFILPLFLVFLLPVSVKAADYNFPYEVDSSSFSGIGPIKSILMNSSEGNYSYDPFEVSGFMIVSYYSSQYNRIQFDCVVPRSNFRIDLYPELTEAQYNFFNQFNTSLKFRFKNCYIEHIYFNIATNTYTYAGYQSVGDFYSDYDLFGNENSYYDFNGVRVGKDFSHQLPVYINGDILINNLLYLSAPQSPAPPLGGVLSMGDLNLIGHSDGFSNDMFNAIAESTYPIFGTNFHTLYSISDISNAPIGDRVNMFLENIFNMLRNLGVLLNKILLSVMWFFDDLLVWVRNFWDNLVIVLSSVVNLIVGTFNVEDNEQHISTWLDSWWNSSLKPFLVENGFLDEFVNFPFVKLLNDIASASIDPHGEYRIYNLIIPEDLRVFKIAFENKLEEESSDILGILNSYNIMFVELMDNVQSGVVPSFTFPSYTLGGHTYKGFSVDLSPLLPYMPTIRLMLSAWMWISFAIYFIRTLPTIIRGSGTFDSGDSNSSDNMVTLGRMTFDENEILSN